MNDSEIRKLLKAKLKYTNNKIVEEFVICAGIVRADVAVIEKIMIGYEIKSDVDTFQRFKLQQECYEKTFDKNYLVVGEKYRNINIPSGWGLIVATINGLETIVEAELNNTVEKQALLDLLWKEELKKFLDGYTGIASKNRRKLRQIILENFEMSKIKDFTISTLLSRDNWKVVT